MKTETILAVICLSALVLSCKGPEQKQTPGHKIRVILDTDTNNELDDQHALAYMLFNQATFRIEAITINTTSSGGNIEAQYAEARRVLQLCDADTLQVYKGADGAFADIMPHIDDSEYDGKAAVDIIIEKAKQPATEKLVLLAIGKLTNPALAIAKDSTIASRIRLVWLGSNYPEPGEHNQDNDTIAMNFLLNHSVDFEMVTVRYGKPSGTDAVSITQEEIHKRMKGLGPRISAPVAGRSGGMFTCFGDYSIDLFEHIDHKGPGTSRPLFDMAAVAIVKDPAWADPREHPAPLFTHGAWIERPQNPRSIIIWENFNRDAIVEDLFKSLGQR